MLDKNSAIPLYKQIKNKILEDIKNANNDTKIKSERVYSEENKISRITVRQAINELVRDRYLIRISGKGTFVANTKGSLEFIKVISFTEDMQKQGYQASSKVLNFNTSKPNRKIIKVLRIQETDNIFELKRIRFANNIAMAYQKSLIVEKYCPNLLDYDFTNLSLYSTLRSIFNLKISYANNILEARLANSAEKKIFNTKREITVFLLKQTTYLENGLPIEYVESVYRGDKYKFFNFSSYK